jgi:pyridoxal phosphate enzyme (YggS family)
VLAARAVGRDPRQTTLIAVTKTFPATDARTLLALGALDLGESRDQEARAKVAALALPAPAGQPSAGQPSAGQPRWHFIGRLQTNKCRSVAEYAHAVHSVDRPELVEALAAAMARGERAPLTVFLQVSIDGDVTRGGSMADDLPRLAALVAASPHLLLAGVMAVAPRGQAPAEAFARLAQLSELLRRDHPEASAISAGMSGDFEAAIRAGATHIRVGSALLGRRGPNVG